MKKWKIAGAVGIILLIFLVYSCKSDPGFTNYRQGVFYGLEALRNGQYQQAFQQFARASQGEPDERLPPALAGQAAYQAGDYAAASQYLARAQALDPNQSSVAYVIVAGYQALLAFRENRRHEGMASLSYYIKLYGDYYSDESLGDVRLTYQSGDTSVEDSYPDESLRDVKRMYQSGDISVPGLELLINQEMNRYAEEIGLAF
jgi:tetratricopeptide (TPR) repeat protein